MIHFNPICMSEAHRALLSPRQPNNAVTRARNSDLRRARKAKPTFVEGPSKLARRDKRKGVKPASVRKAEADAKFASMRTRPA